MEDAPPPTTPPRAARPPVAAAAVAVAAGTLLTTLLWLAAPELGLGCSPDVGFRAQTEALLAGRVALREHPDRLPQDWAWGNGAQQVWGLGVPLLRLPFEALARAVGAPGFPDRALLFLAFVAAGALYFHGLRLACGTASPAAAWLASAVASGSPTLVWLLRYRFGVYEEAIAWGNLMVYALAGLLLSWLARPTRLRFHALLALAGLAPWVRPTLLAYAVPVVAVALWLGARRGLPRAVLAIGLLLAMAGPVALAAGNHHRFGEALEFGHRLNVTRLPRLDLATRFDHPYAREPLASAAAELFGSLFLVERSNGIDFLATGLHPLQSPTERFREFYLPGYGAPELLLLLVGGGAALATRRRAAGAGAPQALAAVSAAGAAALAFFYLRAPWITSRYLLDFAPAFALAAAAGLCTLAAASARLARHWRLLVWGLAAALLAAWLDSRLAGFPAGRLPYYPAKTSLAPAAARARALAALAEATPSVPPTAYRCGASAAASAGLQVVGWRVEGDCSVDVSSSFFLARADCLELWIEGAPASGLPRVLRGLKPLAPQGSRKEDGGRSKIAYCSPAKGGRAVDLYSIAWVDPRRPSPPPPLRLLGVAVGEAGGRATGERSAPAP